MNFKLGYDVNGNKVCKVVSFDGGFRTFSIQTLGNLPATHRDGVCEKTQDEVMAYVKQCGTTVQKRICGIDGQ